MATYNRSGAIAYAQQWWNSHNPAYPFYNSDGHTDCANFVSQCMHEGGEMPMKSTTTGNNYDSWYYYGSGNRSSSWTGAQSLRLFIKYNTVGYPRMGYTFLSNSQVGQLQAGDLVFALNNDGSSKANRTAHHVAIVDRVVGNAIYVYAHSAPKNGQTDTWSYDLSDTILCKFNGTILENGNSGGNTNSWQERYGSSTLRPSNSYSGYVKNLQSDLISLGYDCGSDGADGYFGGNTTLAVRSFQSDNDLTVDGLVGNATKQELYSQVIQ